ncbi:caspase domain-containing protein [Streptomyces sp. NPDC058371]|uniref:caspase family protein n=1 Tax=Streptomyces sp. NPDC058371 TaxID=3346463 RepID=UPI00365B02C8
MYRALLVCNAVFPLEPTRLPRLNGPIRDGLAMWSALTDFETGLFTPENVEVLFDADKDEISRTTERFFGGCSPDDVVLFYYSGHGKKGRANVHLCARNTALHELRSTSFSGEDLTDMLDSSPARSRIVILDCCHSGAFKGDTSNVTPRMLDGNGKGRFVITASGATEPARDAEMHGSPSPFTRALVEALREASPRSPHANSVAVRDVYIHALDIIPEGVPKPQSSLKGVGDEIIAKRPTRHADEAGAAHSPGQPISQVDQTSQLSKILSQRFPGIISASPQADGPSLGDRRPWRMTLVSSLLVGLFSWLAWRAWINDPFAHDDLASYENDEPFFQICGLAALLLAAVCTGESFTSDSSWLRRTLKGMRITLGFAFGLLWLVSAFAMNLSCWEQTMLQSTMGFLFFAAIACRLHDAMFLAGSVVSLLGTFTSPEYLGFDKFDGLPVVQWIICAAMLWLWFRCAIDWVLGAVSALTLLPAVMSFAIHGDLPALALYGAGLALMSAALGDGTRPAHGVPSLASRTLLTLAGAFADAVQRPLRIVDRRNT